MALLPSPPPPASLLVSGLVSTAIQAFLGAKTFQTNTAGAGERAVTIGTSVADGSVNEGFSLLSLRTGIGGTEKEFLRVRRPVNYDIPIVTIDQQSITNTRGLLIANTPAGIGGLKITNAAGGVAALNAQQNGSPVQLYAENKGLELSQNANSYDTTMLMKFLVSTPGGVATSIPAFDFQATAALGTNQKLARFRDNGTDLFSLVRGAGAVAQLELGSATGAISHNGTGFTLASRATNNEYWQGTLFYQTGSGVSLEAQTTARLSSDAGNSAGAVAATSEFATLQTNAGAKIHRFINGGTEKAHVRLGGSAVFNSDVANSVGIGDATELANVAAGLKWSSGAAELGIFSTNNATFLGLNLGTGAARASGAFSAGGLITATGAEFESTLNGGGVLLRAPNGTRYRVTVTNAGAIQVAAAP